MVTPSKDTATETVDPEALLLPVHSIVVCQTCKVSADADAPTTILADGPQLRHKRPPTPLKRRAPAYAPHRADFGTIPITCSRPRPNVPWDCCWDRNWQCSTGGHLREGQRAAFSVKAVRSTTVGNHVIFIQSKKRKLPFSVSCTDIEIWKKHLQNASVLNKKGVLHRTCNTPFVHCPHKSTHFSVLKVGKSVQKVCKKVGKKLANGHKKRNGTTCPKASKNPVTPHGSRV